VHPLKKKNYRLSKTKPFMAIKTENSGIQQVQDEILRAIASIQYGSVEIVIHDGKITHIECREKIRIKSNDAISVTK